MLRLEPPRSVRTTLVPKPEINSSRDSGTAVTILDAQYAIWSHGNEYPVTPNDSDKKDNMTPDIQINSRGFFNPPVMYTRNICNISDSSINEEDHLCKLRITLPK